MTSLILSSHIGPTLSLFFDFIFAWTSVWLILTVIIMMTRHGKNAADYEVIGFRASIGFVMASIFVYRIWAFDPVILVPAYSIFAWTAAATCIRVLIIVLRQKGRLPNAPRPQEPAAEEHGPVNSGHSHTVHTTGRTEQSS